MISLITYTIHSALSLAGASIKGCDDVNTGELLNRVSLLINHDLNSAQVVAQFNELTKKLFRKFPLPDKIYKFTTTSIPYYDLPTDLSEDRIRCVVINDLEYQRVVPEEQEPPCNFCTVLAGKLFVHPNPVGEDAYLYYRQRPITLSETRLTEVPNFPEDYHDLYVYDAAKWIAGLQRDVDMKNNFQAEFDEILRDAERNLRKMGLKQVRKTTFWW